MQLQSLPSLVALSGSLSAEQSCNRHICLPGIALSSFTLGGGGGGSWIDFFAVSYAVDLLEVAFVCLSQWSKENTHNTQIKSIINLLNVDCFNYLISLIKA